MAASLSKVILKLFNEVSAYDVSVSEDEPIENVIKKCEKKGQFVFQGDYFLSFVKSTYQGQKCIRMIFAIKEETGGRLRNIERLVDILKVVEKTLIFVDRALTDKGDGFIYLDIIKILNDPPVLGSPT